MAKYITTATGALLDMDSLVDAAKRPVGFKNKEAEIKPMEAPKPNNSINMRGFMPAQPSVTAPMGTVTEVGKEGLVEASADPVEAPARRKRSLAEMVGGVNVNKADTIKVKPGHQPKKGDGASLAEEIAQEITTGMKQAHKGTVLDDLDDGVEI